MGCFSTVFGFLFIFSLSSLKKCSSVFFTSLPLSHSFNFLGRWRKLNFGTYDIFSPSHILFIKTGSSLSLTSKSSPARSVECIKDIFLTTYATFLAHSCFLWLWSESSKSLKSFIFFSLQVPLLPFFFFFFCSIMWYTRESCRSWVSRWVFLCFFCHCFGSIVVFNWLLIG